MKLFRLTPGKRVLFLTKDPELIRQQLSGALDLRMEALKPEDLLDDVNTDVMTPAWACFDWRPADIAVNAYAGLMAGGERLFPANALKNGNFEVIVSGRRKGTGSSRETAVQAEKWSGIRLAVAESFAPIHARNNINQGVLMGSYALLARLQAGEAIALDEFCLGYDAITHAIVMAGGLFPFGRALAAHTVTLPTRDCAARPMSMGEKMIAAHLLPGQGPAVVQPGDAVLVKVDSGYSHEFTTAQVHAFLEEEFGPEYRVADATNFAVFEDHLIYADGVARMAPYAAKINVLREMQRAFQRHTGVRDYSARDGRSPGICHQIAREHFVNPGMLVQATDSHTCMGGGNNALTFGVGATEYAALIQCGFTMLRVPESIRFELHGKLAGGVTAKDVMLWILWQYAAKGATLDRIMEFGGPGLATLDMDERATLANMATECTAKSGVCEGDEQTVQWIATRRSVSAASVRAQLVHPDTGATYAGGVHRIDLGALRPMVATPGNPAAGIPSDPTNGAFIDALGRVKIDIAYGGSCTAGKDTDLDNYARVVREALAAGLRVAAGVQFMIQCGSSDVEAHVERSGYRELFERAGVQLIGAGCGACIGCGPGVSTTREQVTISAINRNFEGRSGPGQLYLASPLSVAASAFTGCISAYREGMFSRA
ncbi:MAG: aconitate hydratase [Planctomycetes bacterium]|nr:aconitate hydratase [Planctomycetota bacterium]